MPEANPGSPSQERTSLLDNLIAAVKAEGSHVTELARVVLVGTLFPGADAGALAQWHEKTIAALPTVCSVYVA